MTIRRSILVALTVATFALAGGTWGQADPTRTYLTFSGAVALPGVTLARGTYTFENLGSMGLVRVSSRDGRHVYLTAFTNDVVRPARLPRDNHIVFGEAPAGQAPPIEVWFPEYSTRGHAFIW